MAAPVTSAAVSSVATIVVDRAYALVLGGCIASAFTIQIIGFNIVGAARKKAGLKYPAMYYDREEAERDPEKNKFNCAQRGHQNLLETFSSQLFLFLLGGLKYPRITAAATAAYCVGAYSFATQYGSGNPDARYKALGSLVRVVYFISLGTSLSAVLSIGGVLRSRAILSQIAK